MSTTNTVDPHDKQNGSQLHDYEPIDPDQSMQPVCDPGCHGTVVKMEAI